jgi:hypothetical protein
MRGFTKSVNQLKDFTPFFFQKENSVYKRTLPHARVLARAEKEGPGTERVFKKGFVP